MDETMTPEEQRYALLAGFSKSSLETLQSLIAFVENGTYHSLLVVCVGANGAAGHQWSRQVNPVQMLGAIEVARQSMIMTLAKPAEVVANG